MKKSYVKPQVYFEDFQLSASIAAGCEVINKLQTEGVCGYQMSGSLTIFTLSVEGCGKCPIEDGSRNDLPCYHQPNETYNLFNSL